MKRLSVFLCTMLLFFSVLRIANAGLIDHGNATVSQTRNDGSVLMWFQNGYIANAGGPMSWYDANNYIDSLNNQNYYGYNDWRLPSTLPVNGVNYNLEWSTDGSTDRGYGITSPNSELAYLRNVEMPDYNWNLYDVGPFLYVYGSTYWSSTLSPINLDVLTPYDYADAFTFNTSTGSPRQDVFDTSKLYYVWPVRTVTSAPTSVPDASVMLLLGSSLIGLFGVRKKRNQK